MKTIIIKDNSDNLLMHIKQTQKHCEVKLIDTLVGKIKIFVQTDSGGWLKQFGGSKYV